MKEKILEILTEINEDIAGYEGDGRRHHRIFGCDRDRIGSGG